MEKKRLIPLMIFLLFMTAGFVTYFFVYTKQPSIQGDIINNGMDMHGCLVSEGYNWNETEKSCVNDWLTSKYQVVDFPELAKLQVTLLAKTMRQNTFSARLLTGQYLQIIHQNL